MAEAIHGQSYSDENKREAIKVKDGKMLVDAVIDFPKVYIILTVINVLLLLGILISLWVR